MKLYDISMPVSPGMMVYKNYDAKKPHFVNVANHETGHHYETDITLNLHTGTHVDAPLHMIEGGETMEIYALDRFLGPCRVLDLSHVTDMIGQKDLEKYDIAPGENILLKTRNSSEDFFNMSWISLREDGAKYLSEIGINLVGIDALGIERGQSNYMTHKSLLASKIIIIEGLQLKEVKEGAYDLIALPIALENVEASLVRAVLIDHSN